MKTQYGCPVELCLDVLGGKWKPVILARLKAAPQRYSDLRRQIPDLSDKVLTDQLKSLTEAGLVSRSAAGGYGLTSRGQSIRPVLEAMYDWGKQAAPGMGVTVAEVAGTPRVIASNTAARER